MRFKVKEACSVSVGVNAEQSFSKGVVEVDDEASEELEALQKLVQLGLAEPVKPKEA